MKIFCFIFCIVFAIVANAQNIYPTNWWTGMVKNKIQLMCHANGVGEKGTIFTSNNSGIKILKSYPLESKNYLFVDVEISKNAALGNVEFKAKNKNGVFTFPFKLGAKRTDNGKGYAQGVTNKDFIYLIMPDRFCNGNTANDKIPGMLDQTLNRDTVFNRHGGDLQGVQSKLDYLSDLGITTIWLNPVLENNMPDRTEHGYAITNHYKIDERLGGYQAYKNLIEAAHKKGIKIIKDAVYNHCGIEHFFIKDKPCKDWVHNWPTYTNTSYKDQTLFDPYVADIDKKTMSDGWFVPIMPDLNQGIKEVENFLIQHAIWCVEEFGIDGWRVDTYAYNDLEFMNRCNKALYNEYPNITIFGETWVHGVVNQAYFCENIFDIKYKSNLQATTDFQTLLYGIQPALTQDFGWTEGVNKLYTTLAQDIVYKDPTRQVNFLDNHDLPRFWSVLNKNMSKYKMAFSWLLTCRGIPQMYYGNEILMEGFTDPDGNVRKDFMGGWPGDEKNKFTQQGRSNEENEIWNHIRNLARYRKQSSALQTGSFKQFLPVDGVYVYFRYDKKQTIMCVMNTNKEAKEIDMSRFIEITRKYNLAKDIITGNNYTLKGKNTISPLTMWVCELK